MNMVRAHYPEGRVIIRNNHSLHGLKLGHVRPVLIEVVGANPQLLAEFKRKVCPIKGQVVSMEALA